MGAWGVVYTATNLITGEQYVGQTKQPPHVRFRAHEISARNPKTKFHRALADAGYNNFIFEVVASSLTREALNAAEKALISAYVPAYNTTCGGAGRPREVTKVERQRLSEAAKRRWADPEWSAVTVASIRRAASTEAHRERGRRIGQAGTGAKARWKGHTPTPAVPKDRSKSMVASWDDPAIRARRLSGLAEANKRPEVRVKRSIARRGKAMPADAIAASARKKWKPVYCPELQITFLSRLAAAEYIQVGKTTVTEALRHNRKVAGKYTLQEVSHQL